MTEYGPQAEKWFRRASRDLEPRLRGSAAFLSIVPPAGPSPDPKFCLELGMAIMLNKPILAICFEGRACPPGLLRVAHEVIDVPDLNDPAAMERVQDAVTLLVAEHGEPGDA